MLKLKCKSLCKTALSILLLSMSSAYGGCYTQICIHNTSTDSNVTFHIDTAVQDHNPGIVTTSLSSTDIPPTENWGPYCIQYYKTDGCPKIRFALSEAKSKTQILGATVEGTAVTDDNRYQLDRYPVDGPKKVYRQAEPKQCRRLGISRYTCAPAEYADVILYNVGYIKPKD